MSMRKAFTLMEINLAIMIMAGGILSILGLYGLGYRENRQSREDVTAAAYADAVLSPLVAALSSPELEWENFNKIEDQPGRNGWGEYFQGGYVVSDPEGKAKDAFGKVMGWASEGVSSKVSKDWPSRASGMGENRLKAAGLVVFHDKDSSIVRIGFRAAREAEELMSMPLFYTEVRYQGPTPTGDREKGTK